MLIGYARVSTVDQNHDLQLDALTAAGCKSIFKETASGALRERPKLRAALASMQAGDTLIVWRLDRMARSLRHLLETVEGLEERGMKFRSLTEAIDTSTAGGKLIFQLFGALAEFERSLIRERTYAGLASARIRGRRGGRPQALSAANIDEARRRLLDPSAKVKDVARTLGVSSSTLYRHLRASPGNEAT